MGIYIHLNILPDRIDPQAWRNAYLESVQLLQKWPPGILGLRSETVGSAERLIYSSRIEHEITDDKKRYWKVEGDQESRQFGETFEIYYDMDAYGSYRMGREKDPDESILDNLLGERCSVGYTVFSSKTQGMPYHFIILAVGMLFEDAFPQAALVAGDITLGQARNAQQIIKELLNKDVSLPLCADPERLLLGVLREGANADRLMHVLNGFYGNTAEVIRIMQKHVSPDMLRQCYAKRLSDRPEPNTLGFEGFVIDWLNATNDLPTLIEMACLDEDGPKADPVKVAKSLVSTWLTIDPAVAQQFSDPPAKDDDLQTIDDMFRMVYMRMAGLQGRSTQYHVDEETLLSEFKKLFPQHAEQFDQIVAKRHAELQKNLAGLSDQMKQIESLTKSPQKEERFTLKDLKGLKKFDPIPEGLSKILDDLASSMHTGVANLLGIEPELALKTPDEIRFMIYTLSSKFFFPLTEAGWQWIDQTSDKVILLIILLMLTNRNQELSFVNFKKYLLEHPDILTEVSRRIEKM
jgi:hypothetical protein